MFNRFGFRWGKGAAFAGLLQAVMLSGCAGLGDTVVAEAFVDPAKYDQYDCKQLEAERKSLAEREATTRGLIDKAKTGAGGAVVAEVAYRNDYLAIRASSRLVEETWRRNRCVPTTAATTVPTAGPAVPKDAKGRDVPTRSGNAVY